jgi:chemotaxis protein CheX
LKAIATSDSAPALSSSGVTQPDNLVREFLIESHEGLDRLDQDLVARPGSVLSTETAMQYLEQEIISLTQDIWGATLNLDAVPHEAPAPLAPGRRTLDGVINITGAWAGAVVLQVAEPVARRAAAVMFGLDADRASLDDMQDAVGELTNMTGGNIKALLDGQCALSLPAVVEGRDYSIRVPGSEPVTRIGFDIEGEPVVVSLLARRERAEAAPERRPVEYSHIL